MWIPKATENGERADSSAKSMIRSAILSCCFPLEICGIQGSHVERVVSLTVRLPKLLKTAERSTEVLPSTCHSSMFSAESKSIGPLRQDHTPLPDKRETCIADKERSTSRPIDLGGVKCQCEAKKQRDGLIEIVAPGEAVSKDAATIIPAEIRAELLEKRWIPS